MSMEKDSMSPQESLQLITQMIRTAQGNVYNNSFYFLLWGWCVAIAYFGMYALMKFTNYPHPYIIWTITIPAWIVTFIHSYRADKSHRNSTHLDRINMWLWLCMAFAIAPICLFGEQLRWNISPIILIMIAIPTFVSGIALRFKPLLFGGINFWLAGIIAFMLSYQNQYLIGGIAVILGYLVPGYMLKAKKF